MEIQCQRQTQKPAVTIFICDPSAKLCAGWEVVEPLSGRGHWETLDLNAETLALPSEAEGKLLTLVSTGWRGKAWPVAAVSLLLSRCSPT